MKKQVTLIGTLLFAIVVDFQGCGTDWGNPPGQETASTDPRPQPETPDIEDVFLKFSAYEAEAPEITNLVLCIEEIEFKMEATASDGEAERIEFEIGEVQLDARGTNIAAIEVPNGTYERIEIELSNECDGDSSVQVTNSNGSFSTAEEIELRFNGAILFSENSNGIELLIQQIAVALEDVSAGSQIAPAIESLENSFEEDDD